MPWPPDQKRFAHTALPGAAFAIAQQSCRTAVQILSQPRAVVRSEDDEGVARQPLIAKRLQHLADAPIEYFHCVAIDTAAAGAAQMVRSEQRHMREGVREIQTAGAVFVCLDEADRFVGVAARERLLVGRSFVKLLSPQEWHIEIFD